MAALPPFVTREQVLERLPIIFPEGTPNRTYCVRELAVSTVFAALYIGAIDGSGRYLGPVHVYRMTDEQASKSDKVERESYAEGVLRRNFRVSGTRWYADNTREPIRDETLRGLVAIGAVVRREDLPTTSGNPRYALKPDFAALMAAIYRRQRGCPRSVRRGRRRRAKGRAAPGTRILRAGVRRSRSACPAERIRSRSHQFVHGNARCRQRSHSSAAAG
jgi:hypothetical protein